MSDAAALAVVVLAPLLLLAALFVVLRRALRPARHQASLHPRPPEGGAEARWHRVAAPLDPAARRAVVLATLRGRPAPPGLAAPAVAHGERVLEALDRQLAPDAVRWQAGCAAIGACATAAAALEVALGRGAVHGSWLALSAPLAWTLLWVSGPARVRRQARRTATALAGNRAAQAADTPCCEGCATHRT